MAPRMTAIEDDLTNALAEAGLVEHSDVDSCTSEHRDRDGEWHRCTEPGDHEGDHENDYVGSWRWDDVDDPRQVRRYWVEMPTTAAHLAAVLAPIVAKHVAAGQERALLDAAEEVRADSETSAYALNGREAFREAELMLTESAATYTTTTPLGESDTDEPPIRHRGVSDGLRDIAGDQQGDGRGTE